MTDKITKLEDLLDGGTFPHPYKLNLRPSEALFLKALENNETVNINKLQEVSVSAEVIHVLVHRLRKKLPKKVTIESIYGGFYYLPDESKQELQKHKRK